MISDEERAALVAEAETWLGTKFHHEQRLKGVGADCGQFLIGVYSALGYAPNLKVEHYPIDFAIHRGREWYKELVETYGDETAVPLPGDTVLYRFGRSFSHGAIVTKWPQIIHAWMPLGQVCRFRGDLGPLEDRPRIYFTPRVRNV